MDRVAAMERWYWRDPLPGARGNLAFTPPPPWAAGASSAYPYLKFGEQFVSSFLLERPTDEFSRDARGYL